MRIRTGIFGASAIGLFVAIVQGCATEAVVIDETEDSGSVEPVADSGKKDSSTARDSSTTTDSSTKTDAAKPDATVTDSSVDAADSGDGAVADRPGEMFDPLAPKEGAACPVGTNLNDVIERRCGYCGTQKAFCEAGPGGTKIVGTYAPCNNEKTNADRCLPNARNTAACGFCGTQIRNCDTTCSYITGLCQNEVVGGCVANEVSYIEGVCGPTTVPPSNATDVRKQTCSATCTKGTPEPCAPRPIDEIVVSQTAGTTVGADVGLITSKIARLSTGACPTTATSTLTSYQYVRVKNNGADSVNVTIANAAPVGGSKQDTVVTYYPGPNLPADRLQCSGSVTDTPETVTVNIPAGGSVLFHQSLYSASNSATKTRVEVKTNFVGAEVAPAPQYTMSMSQTNAAFVDQAITFDPAKVLDRPDSPVVDPDPCPFDLSGSLTNYSYVRVNNTGATDRTVTLETTGATDTMLAYYMGPAPLSANRTACTGQFADETGTVAVAGVSKNALLSGITIPAMGYITVYVSKYQTATGGTSNLRVTTTN